jgi:di/tricarboxylate transporter
MRLLEIDHEELGSESPRPALIGLGIYAAAVIATGVLALPVSIVMVAAALAMCLLRLVPGNEIYRSIDWQVIVLLAAMIPIGRAFHDTGATDSVAAALGWALGDASFPMAVAVLCMASMLLSSFLNNVATTLVMGQVAVETAQELSLNLDAALLAVLVGSSCSFLTPIAHQNNLLVMRPGGYLFADYLRVGLPLTAIVIATTAYVLTTQYG